MNFLSKLLSQNEEVSCGRLMSLVSLFIGASIAYVGLFRGCDLSGSTPAIAVFVGAAFGGHVAQKYAENGKP